MPHEARFQPRNSPSSIQLFDTTTQAIRHTQPSPWPVRCDIFQDHCAAIDNCAESKNSSQHNQSKKNHRNGYASPTTSLAHDCINRGASLVRAMDSRRHALLHGRWLTDGNAVSRSLRRTVTLRSRAPTPSSAGTTGMLFTAPSALWCVPPTLCQRESDPLTTS